ncbi:hypothetical protein PVT71_13615 [Salipiger sp. H15]|uniref:Gene transfer agent family protein n=1 Tax=Alloyangia sp. H15 TaxID=3029062 RepID=A0AAU8AF53_9RHOB
MSNRFLGEVDVTVDGKAYKLRFDFNAMCEFEDHSGKDAMQAFEAVEAGKIGIRDLRLLTLACMLRHHPEATLQEAGDLISHDLSAVMKVMRAAAPAAGDGPGTDQGGAEGNAAPGTAA